VSQPFDRTCAVPAPKAPDKRLKDWWVENPWLINQKGKSLSGHERNRVFLNDRGESFYEISALTSADSDGDGRSVVAMDFTSDGMEDLIVRQAGGGPLFMFENRFPKAHWLDVWLVGDKSNKQGIGARVIAMVDGRRIVRENFPVNGFKAQGPAYVHLGLGAATKAEKLTIKWPSGVEQEFTDLAGGRAIRVHEGQPDPLPTGAPKQVSRAEAPR
jgi:hypothetical protein